MADDAKQALRDTMGKRSDQELKAIVTVAAGNYREEALAAAREELQRRGIDPAAVAPPSAPVEAPRRRALPRIRLQVLVLILVLLGCPALLFYFLVAGPLGAPCSSAAACRSRICLQEGPFVQYCSSSCTYETEQKDCGDAYYCQAVTGSPKTFCVRKARKEFGEACFSSGECVQGDCLRIGSPAAAGVCGQWCKADADCPAGVACVKGNCIPPARP